MAGWFACYDYLGLMVGVLADVVGGLLNAVFGLIVYVCCLIIWFLSFWFDFMLSFVCLFCLGGIDWWGLVLAGLLFLICGLLFDVFALLILFA